jgi:hypothetical protein
LREIAALEARALRERGWAPGEPAAKVKARGGVAWDGVASGPASARSVANNAESTEETGDILTDFYATKAGSLGLSGRYHDYVAVHDSAAPDADEDGNAQTKKIAS